MERLTKRIGEHVYYTKLDYNKTIPSEYNPNDIGRILQALCAYEATNHTPEECAAAFEELAAYRAAEQDGTLLRLPCKVGDTVWTNFSISGSYLKRKNRPYACTVIFIGLNQSDSGGYINVQYNGSDYQFSFDFDQIGKTVFLTREDAEAALKEQEGKK